MNQVHSTIIAIDEQEEYGLCNSRLQLDYGEHIYRLTAGTTDSIQVFEQGTILYVLTVNTHLDYLALDWYQGSESEPVDSIFLQGDWSIKECIDYDWRSLTLAQLAERLVQLFA